MKAELVWRIGGEAGHGIKAVGSTFARMCAVAGYHVFDEAEYPSLIRGGHTTQQVVASTSPVHAGREKTDLLVALNDETIKRHLDELFPDGGVIWDKVRSKLDPTTLRSDIRAYDVPLYDIAFRFGGEIMRNTVALGASAALFESDFELVTAALKITFAGKNPEILRQNAQAAAAGYEHVRKTYPQHLPWRIQHHPSSAKATAGRPNFAKTSPFTPGASEDRSAGGSTRQHLYLAGNEAVGLGALRGGVSFYAAYPMTPSSPVLEFLAAHATEFGIVVKHAEDEIAVMNMAVGAGYAGVRSMLGTSGGGFSLMVEALGLAGMTEAPVVIYLGQRPGPSTGLPTWTEQGDLLFALHAAQGDFPRALVAPGDVQECFYETIRALNIAEHYQMPVFVVSDKFLAESHHDTPAFDLERVKVERAAAFAGSAGKVSDLKEPFPRYAPTQSGVSLRALPGTPGGVHVANSDEHDEVGYSEEDAQVRIAQMEKRMKKLTTLAPTLPQPVVEGDGEAEVNILCWGSTKGPVRDALTLLGERGIKANFLNITWLHPFPEEAVNQFVHNARHLVLVENNFSGQFGQLVQLHTGKKIPYRLLKYSGRQFYPEEIVRKIQELVRHG